MTEVNNQLNKKIQEIRNLMDEMKEEIYSIINEELVNLDEYIKTLYLKVLCTVVQYENEPSEMQLLYLKRIISGMKAEKTMEEYMYMALEISADDIQEFFLIMKDNKIKYYFALDGILLLAMKKSSELSRKYLVELIELCHISKKDLEFLSLVAKSILYQESSYYNEAKVLINNNQLKELNFKPYMENYYVGAIIDTPNKKFFYAPKGTSGYEISYPVAYCEEEVCFENVDIEISEDWNFNGCGNITFKNCKIKSLGGHFVFKSVETLRFEECEFSGFSKRVAYIESVNEFASIDCKYFECGYQQAYEDENGGVFFISKRGTMNLILLKGNTLTNCYIRAKKVHYYVNGIFIGLDVYKLNEFIVVENIFNSCDLFGISLGNVLIEGEYRDAKIRNENNICRDDNVRIFKS